MTDTAQTILNQLGGNKFSAMTGASNLINHGDALSFKLPARFANNGINYVKITLNADDLYDIEFGKTRGIDYTIKALLKGIACDKLQSEFKNVTGLDTYIN